MADLSRAEFRGSKTSPSERSNGAASKPRSTQTKSDYNVKIPSEQLLRAFREMVLARLVDEKAIVLYKQNKCHFQIGVAGHEAVQVAAGHVFRAGKDWFYPYYREMAICAALGMTEREFMLNAMNKQDDPNSHGRQMPMHYGHKALNIVSQSSPTGTQFLQAVGAALALKKKGNKAVVYVSAGEGTCSQGDYHEALNWAAREKLPVIFMIQNNNYAISVHISEQLAGESAYKISAGYENLERYEVDGSDYIASYEVTRRAYDRALNGDGPAMIEAHVPRLQSHSISDNHLKYRTSEDIEKEKERCPIIKMRALLIKNKIASEQELAALEEEIKRNVDSAAEWAEAQSDCDPSCALDHNYVEPDPASTVIEGVADGPEVYMVDAINHGLDEELARDPDVYVYGQDVAHGKGGVFTVTAGLTAKHGVDRVFNGPLAESSIVGVAIGMATLGLKPVAEIQFGDYVWTAMMQIRNELAMLHYRSAGDFSCPAVLRIAVGGYIHGACYHSQNIEATFAHFPGLYVLYPSNATDAKGLLKAAIRGKDPVLFLEHKGLYRQVYAKGPEGNAECLVPLGRAKTVREGSDLTIVTWGALVNKSLLAAKELDKEGYSVEVIDLRTIVPFDQQAVFESVRKTNKVLIAHEDTLFMGFGAEIAAQIASDCFRELDAPVKRLGMKYAAAVAHASSIENVVLPQNEDVLNAAREVLAF
ncbi:MAG: tungsten formylmethanofuran dehydrogenase [Proteobacteria bacterium]|nr:MAG: tungsten formylmethanofuran dehydrogenase [Pseudomonadota bacterium]